MSMQETIMSMRQTILAQLHRMPVGFVTRYASRTIEAAFPRNPLSGRPPIDALTENLTGANYGAFVVRQDLATGDYIISRHEPGDTPVRRDFDRRHIPLPHQKGSSA